jgi:biopolymer transport protein ExbB/TolQ
MMPVLQALADFWIFVVLGVAAVNFAMFLLLRNWTRRGPRRLVSYLQDILGAWRRSNSDADRTVHEQIDCFVQDIREILSDEADREAREEMSRRLLTKDEARGYLKRDHTEWLASVAGTLVEVHPLNGILGTVLAIAASIGAETTAGSIVRNFANASFTTLVGLMAGVVFMIWNASMAPAIARHFEHLSEVRQVVQSARNRMIRHAGGDRT